MFEQMVTLCAYSEESDVSIPLGHFLLNTKEQKYYEKSLQAWVEIVEEILGTKFNADSKIRTCVSDFERGLINAVEKVLKIPITGCFFHFCQALWREAGFKGLKQRSLIKETKRLLLYLILLCFCPLTQVSTMLEQMFKYSDEAYKKFLKYFEETWMKSMGIEKWNYSLMRKDQLQLSTLKRTNNYLEGFHGAMSLKLGKVLLSFSKISLTCWLCFYFTD